MITNQLRNKNILIVSPESWDKSFVSKHNYAIHLAKRGNKVFFLNPPSRQSECKPTEYENIWLINYTGFIKGLRFLPLFLQKWFMLKEFKRIEVLCKVSVEIIWSFDNSVFYNFNALPKSVLKISHIVDLTQNFQMKTAAKTADFCFGSSRYIVSLLKRYQLKSYFIHHGSQCLVCRDKEDEIRLPGKNNIKVFYAGNLDIKYLRWDLLEELIDEYSYLDFIFAGRQNTFRPVYNKSNAYYLGVLPSSDLLKYYHASDILLLAYDSDKYLEQLANPHKMMDYLCAGKVVVATKTIEFEESANSELIAMSENNSEYKLLFNNVVLNLNYWNSQKLISKRKTFARANSYPRQIERIESIIY